MPPTKLAHVVYQTNRMAAMRDWYCAVLDGHVIYENPHLSFVTYDEEHHRVALQIRQSLSAAPLGQRSVGQQEIRRRVTYERRRFCLFRAHERQHE